MVVPAGFACFTLALGSKIKILYVTHPKLLEKALLIAAELAGRLAPK
jgi:hypothetical protein